MLTTKKNEAPTGFAQLNGGDLIRDTVRDLRAYQVHPEEPSWKGDFIERALRAIPKVIAPLRNYASGPFKEYLLEDHRSEINDLESDIAIGTDALVSATINALHSREISAVNLLVDSFRWMERSATSLVTLLSIETEERSFSSLSSQTQKPSSDPKSLEVARTAALAAKRAMVQVVNGAISGRTLIKRLVSREIEANQPKDRTNAARLKRQRERRRKGVAYRANVNVYFSELELLRHLGFLSAADKNNKEAVQAALEAFIIAAFRSYPDDMTWVDRHRFLMDRMQAEREDDEPDASE